MIIIKSFIKYLCYSFVILSISTYLCDKFTLFKWFHFLIFMFCCFYFGIKWANTIDEYLRDSKSSIKRKCVQCKIELSESDLCFNIPTNSYYCFDCIKGRDSWNLPRIPYWIGIPLTMGFIFFISYIKGFIDDQQQEVDSYRGIYSGIRTNL